PFFPFSLHLLFGRLSLLGLGLLPVVDYRAWRKIRNKKLFHIGLLERWKPRVLERFSACAVQGCSLRRVDRNRNCNLGLGTVRYAGSRTEVTRIRSVRQSWHTRSGHL